MLGIDATYGDVSFDRGRNPNRVLHPIIPGAIALALTASAAAWVLHGLPAADSNLADARSAAVPTAGSVGEAASKPFGDIVIDAAILSQLRPASPAQNSSSLASLEAVPPPPAAIPLPRLEPFPPAPSAAIPAPAELPLPPKRDLPEIADAAPLPPPRPPEFGMPARPATLDHPTAPPAAAPADNRNFFQKLFGLGLPSAPAVASRPGVAPAPVVASRPAAPAPVVASRPAAPAPVVASAAPETRSGGRGLPAAFTPVTNPASGYDRWTAVYDISARTVYLPDGTRLEAHSGLGDRLDDPRYVSERMRGATPPSVYELEPREASFHGVQALRLKPIGDSGVFGRAGLLAHSYMLGPNGDSNGCVSFKDYAAFLRAYQNGQVKKLVVVAKL